MIITMDKEDDFLFFFWFLSSHLRGCLRDTTNSIVLYRNVFNEKVFILFVKDLKSFYSIP